ncbi:MAG: hypothetical protein WBA16_01445 [Nonlabens sp.]
MSTSFPGTSIFVFWKLLMSFSTHFAAKDPLLAACNLYAVHYGMFCIANGAGLSFQFALLSIVNNDRELTF